MCGEALGAAVARSIDITIRPKVFQFLASRCAQIAYFRRQRTGSVAVKCITMKSKGLQFLEASKVGGDSTSQFTPVHPKPLHIAQLADLG